MASLGSFFICRRAALISSSVPRTLPYHLFQPSGSCSSLSKKTTSKLESQQKKTLQKKERKLMVFGKKQEPKWPRRQQALKNRLAAGDSVSFLVEWEGLEINEKGLNGFKHERDQKDQ